MGDVHEAPRPRIAAAQLAQHIGRPVCFVGRVEKIHPTGKLIVLSDGEGCHATVELSEPVVKTSDASIRVMTPQLSMIEQMGESHTCMAGTLGISVCVPLLCQYVRKKLLDEEISGVLEVVGRVTNQATIMCMSYVQFREDKSPFDLQLYNEALKIIHEFPEYFPFGTEKNS